MSSHMGDALSNESIARRDGSSRHRSASSMNNDGSMGAEVASSDAAARNVVANDLDDTEHSALRSAYSCKWCASSLLRA